MFPLEHTFVRGFFLQYLLYVNNKDIRATSMEPSVLTLYSYLTTEVKEGKERNLWPVIILPNVRLGIAYMVEMDHIII